MPESRGGGRSGGGGQPPPGVAATGQTPSWRTEDEGSSCNGPDVLDVDLWDKRGHSSKNKDYNFERCSSLV